MNWLPISTDFQHRLKAALAAPAEARVRAMHELAQVRMNFLETIQLDNALRRVGAEAARALLPVKLALLASSTIDQLLPAIRVAGLRRGMRIQIYPGAYGQFRQELLDPASGLRAFAPDFVLLSLTARELVAAVPVTASPGAAETALTDLLTELQELWKVARNDLGAAVIQQSFLDVTETLFGSYDRLVPGAPAGLVARLNHRLGELIASDQVLLLDVARVSARDGLEAWFDIRRWLQGKIEIAPQAAPMYGELVARLIAAQRGQSKKCLVLDLDNTLWGGVIGDDGLEGIVIGEGSAAGEAHLSLQRYAKALRERGILLAVCSKNEPAIAAEAFARHPEMALRIADFAAFIANWDDKVENIKTIAAQLNIGLDSLVFVDDNPVERARVRENLPMVAVPELPADPAHYVRCIADAGYFETVSFTTEDRERAGQYVANAERDALRGASKSMEEFLRNLDMSVTYGAIRGVDLPRATQLLNKTNQFNTTNLRYTREELAAFVANGTGIALQYRLVDKFGDNGLVSVMILAPLKDESGALEVVNWVMSCRVFGRKLEDEAMNIAVEAARREGFAALRADYIPTSKNAVVRGLYEKLGFARIADPALGETTRWTIDLSTYCERPTPIVRVAQVEA